MHSRGKMSAYLDVYIDQRYLPGNLFISGWENILLAFEPLFCMLFVYRDKHQSISSVGCFISFVLRH